MFDMPRWSAYLSEYCENAQNEGATPVDILELFYIQSGMLLPRVKAEEILGRSDYGQDRP